MQARPPSWSERAIRALLVGPVGQAGLPQVGRKPGEAGLPGRPGRHFGCILVVFWYFGPWLLCQLGRVAG